MIDTQANGGRQPVLVIGGGIAGMTAAIEAAEAGCEVVLVEKSPVPRRPRRAQLPVLPQALSAGLRPGDQLQADQEQPSDPGPDPGRASSRSRGSPGDYEATIVDRAALRDRRLHALRRVRAGLSGRAPRRLQPRDCRRPRPPTCRTAWRFRRAYAIDRAACGDGLHGVPGRLRVRRHRSRPADRAHGRSRWPPSSRRRAGRPTTPRRSTTSASARYPNVVTNVMMERLAAPDGPTKGRIAAALRRAAARVGGLRAVRRVAATRTTCPTARRSAARRRSSRPPTSASCIRTPRSRSSTSTSGRRAGSRTSTRRWRPTRSSTLIKGKVAKVEEDPATQDLLVDGRGRAAAAGR